MQQDCPKACHYILLAASICSMLTYKVDSMKSKRSAPIWKQVRGQRYTIEPRTAQMTSDAVRNQTSDHALRNVRVAIRFGPRDSVTKKRVYKSVRLAMIKELLITGF